MRKKRGRSTRFAMSDKMFRSLVFGGRYNIFPHLHSMFSPSSNRKANQKVELARVFAETLDEVASLRLLADGLAAANESYRYGLGERDRHLASLRFVSSAMGTHKKILDIGCGDGLMALLFQRIGLEVCTLDMADPPPVGNYGAILKKLLAFRGVEFKRCHLGKDSLPFPAQTFDIIHMAAVIEHLPQSHKKVLDNIRRILKDNGILIMDTPNLTHFANRIAFLLGKPVLAPIEQFYNIKNYHGHFREFTLEEVRAILHYSGFRICSLNMVGASILPVLKYENFTLRNKLRYAIVSSCSKAVSTIFPQLKDCIWVAAVKAG